MKQIKEVFREEFKTGFREGFTEVWEGNLEPSLNQLHEAVAQLPTKSYLDDKLANLEGDLIKKLRKEDEKVNRIAQLLKEKQIFTDKDVTELQNLQVFPK